MPLSIQKSVNVGLKSFSLSRDGVAVSARFLGIQLSHGPSAHHVRFGAKGAEYRDVHWNPALKSPIAGNVVVAPQVHAPAMREIESGDVAAMVGTSSAAVVGEINRRRGKLSVTPWLMLLCGIGIWVGARIVSPAVTIPLSLVVCLLARVWDLHRKTTVLMYDCDESALVRIRAFQAKFDALKSACRVWHIDSSGRVAARDRKYQAGAKELCRREVIMPSYRFPKFVRANISVPSILVGKQSLHFFPDHVLVVAGARVGAIDYAAIEPTVDQTNFIETEGVPPDARVVDKTWRYTNKNGGPDRRFRQNPEIPVARYEQLLLRSSTGLNELIQVSRVGAAAIFAEGVRSMAVPAQPSVPNSAPEPPTPAKSNIEQLADDALGAVQNIMAETRRATAMADASARAAYDNEIQESILALIAAVVFADGKIHPGEQEFLRIVAVDLDSPDRCEAFVATYTARWNSISESAPKYFEAIVAYDHTNRSKNAQKVIADLRRIVACAAMADGAYDSAELATASAHLEALERVFRKATWTVEWNESTALPQISPETSYRRDEFGRREIE